MSNTFSAAVNSIDDKTPAPNLKKSLIEILSQLSCPICQDVPTQPHLLPTCGHTFCYDCIKSWFPCNPSCPVCRAVIGEKKPILNHALKSVIHAVFSNLQSLTDQNTARSLNDWLIERNREYNTDRESDFPWLKKIPDNWARAVVDNEDGVPRCSACHWELIDGHCENCGRTMVGWQDRSDGDEIDGDEDDEEDENLFRHQHVTDGALSSDYDDYDNGLRDMPNRFVHNEADDDDDEDDEEEDDDGVLDEEYESDDGFVVEDDDVSRMEESDDDDDDDDEDEEFDKRADSQLESGDEDIIHTATRTNPSKPIFTDSDPDIVELSDIDSDNDLIKTPHTTSNRKNKSKKQKNSHIKNIVKIPSSDEENDAINIDLEQDSDDELLNTFRSSKKPILPDSDEEEEEEEQKEEEEHHENITTTSKKKRKHKHKHKHKRSKHY